MIQLEHAELLLPQVISNVEGLYEGDMWHYHDVLVDFADNLELGYHNLRHMLHIFWECYDACRFYGIRLSLLDWRDLLIAAIMHDFDHTGRTKYDHLNIQFALLGLRKHIAPQDLPRIERIEAILSASQFPYTGELKDIPLEWRILRDADRSQVFSDAWLQQIVVGLGREMKVPYRSMLERQIPFLENLEFYSEWGRQKYAHRIPKKIEETRMYIERRGTPIAA